MLIDSLAWVRDRINPHPVISSLPINPEKAECLATLSPCVIMGRGHSGTRLLAGILSRLGVNLGTDFEKHRSGDLSDSSFKQHIRKIAINNVDPGRVPVIAAKDLNRFQKAVYGFYQRLDPGVSPWGWKFPETYMIGPCVSKTFPRAPFDEAARICCFLGMDMTEQCHEYLETVIDPNKAAQYRQQDPSLVREVEALIGPELQRLGY